MFREGKIEEYVLVPQTAATLGIYRIYWVKSLP